MAEANNLTGLAAEISRLRSEVARLQAELVQAREKVSDSVERSKAMLFMLEDVEKFHRELEVSKQAWMATFDSISDPLFIHDKEMQLVRANKAYLAASGAAEFKQIIGK